MRNNNMMVDGIAVNGDYLILANKTVLVASYFDRAKVKVKAIAASLGEKQLCFQHNTFITKGESFRTVFKPVAMRRDHFVYTTSVNKEVGTRYLITTEKYLYEDIYNFLMTNYKLPLLKNWMSSLVTAFLNDGDVYKESPYSTYKSAGEVSVPMHGEYISIEEIRVYDFACLTEEKLEGVVSRLLKNKKIRIAEHMSKPLKFKDFSEYMEKYGNLSATKLEEKINPLVPLKGTVDTFAGLRKRMYPQQAAVVNGLIALMESGARYGLNVAEMGCGKTEMGMALVDAAMNQKWLKLHPNKTLKDIYLENAVNYRAIMMAPGHLISKWKEEIISEIPAARVEVIDDFKKLVAIREEGKNPVGRKWYLISKDFCKLGAQYSPIPTVVGTSYVTKNYCLDCYESHGIYSYQVGTGKKAHCPKCNGHRFKPITLRGEGKYRGLMCPKCNNLLLSGKKSDDLESDVLNPSDFSSRTTVNSVCAVCGQQLWGVEATNVSNIIGFKEHESKWRKITHYKNYAHKAKKSSFVLKGYEKEYLNSIGLPDESYTECQRTKGPRKYAPSLYIKKYLKGYFDVCVLDEVHKYENGGTAQSNAASALHSVSRFTLGLTGTLSNGNAASFFYLLYMLDPERMRRNGYAYTDMMKFVSDYGSIETVYEAGKEEDGVYNSFSRGRILRAPKVCPGISPLLFTDFLLDRCIMLNLEDLSKYLPSLTEEVVSINMPADVELGYRHATETLKGLTRNKEGGRTALSNMLQIGLSYPDKPYGRSPIKSGNFKDMILCTPKNLERYKNEFLPKEEKLIDIVTSELSENRNCFIYCSYTGQEESNVMDRLKTILVKTGISEQDIYILRAESPGALQREEFFHNKAAEGVRVFICNCKLVETGLDFCFFHNGKKYNYPTLIFYQISYELSVMWQASRRAWRLSQTEECRNYYLAYENTVQMAALELMAEKQVAASAIQGKFSVDGLAAMAKGTDTRIALAQKLSDSDFVSGSGLSKMFDALNNRNGKHSDSLQDAEMSMLFSELMGEDFLLNQQEEQGVSSSTEQIDTLFSAKEDFNKDISDMACMKEDTTSIMSLPSDSFKVVTIVHDFVLYEKEQKKKKVKKRKALENQVDLFDFFVSNI